MLALGTVFIESFYEAERYYRSLLFRVFYDFLMGCFVYWNAPGSALEGLLQDFTQSLSPRIRRHGVSS
jgi:hypothetical protein